MKAALQHREYDIVLHRWARKFNVKVVIPRLRARDETHLSAVVALFSLGPFACNDYEHVVLYKPQESVPPEYTHANRRTIYYHATEGLGPWVGLI